MNRYPLWKYLVMLVALAIGLLYTLPNFFGEAPAVQISSGKATAKVDSSVLQKVEDSLSASQIHSSDITFDNSSTSASIRVRLASTDEQLHARDVLSKALNTDQNDPTFVVALNLQSKSPKWLSSLHALPMYLGLDLRGGVHFLLQVDMDGALAKRLDADATDARNALRDKEIRDGGVNRSGSTVVIDFADAQTADQARALLLSRVTELQWATRANPQGGTQVVGTFSPAAERTVQENALKQNMSTLHNRVNELGVTEPVIQQQGPERIVVELPGVQDTAKAKSIIGRTATLEARLADPTGLHPNPGDPVPPGDQLFTQGNAAPVLLRKQVIFTGDQITDAGATFDEHQRPAVKIRLNSAGGRILRDVSRDNIGKPMAIVLFERGSGEVLTVATIQSELGESFQITGAASTEAANDLALLLRAGSLAAPMNIIEERTIGPSLGADNIRKGFDSVKYGFAAIALFMLVYYMLFGAFSVISLSVNLLLLVAVLSLLQATLTLPGIAAIALALGMAIDSNVLINERIREELRRGAPPQTAISEGFRHAWATILDSNVTTLIAGIALLAFGSGPVRGFAMVHCIGILTSMFSAVFFSRGLVNLWYGGKKRLKSLAIGQVWRPEGATPTIDQLEDDDGGVEVADEVVDQRNRPVKKAAAAGTAAAQTGTKRGATKDAGAAGGTARTQPGTKPGTQSGTPPRTPNAKR